MPETIHEKNIGHIDSLQNLALDLCKETLVEVCVEKAPLSPGPATTMTCNGYDGYKCGRRDKCYAQVQSFVRGEGIAPERSIS
jgi:hypothetical protein